PPPEAKRAAVLGEFGGLGLPVRGHTWQDEKNWGYRSFTDAGALTDAYVDLLRELRLLAGQGLCAAVYTQTTDVEVEVNGLLTYDRAVEKMDRARVRAANLALRRPPPKVDVVVPCAPHGHVTWRFVTESPGDGWQRPEFDDAGWQEGPGGFGTRGTPGARVGTEWRTGALWLRRRFTLPADVDPATLWLVVHHDEDAVVCVNGVEVARLPGYRTSYGFRPLPPEAARAFRVGDNVLAVHCTQTAGGQFIDVGFVAVRE
ncbi:MAG TPA: hypothetical protein VK081_12915, partial [Planctomycetota bacterium]|nr:hypothetical protein [Planctomycetota bacterium]